MQKRTNFFDSSLLSIVPDIPLVIRNKPHNNQLCADLSRLISAYPVVSHFLRFAWQTTKTQACTERFLFVQALTFISIRLFKQGFFKRTILIRPAYQPRFLASRKSGQCQRPHMIYYYPTLFNRQRKRVPCITFGGHGM